MASQANTSAENEIAASAVAAAAAKAGGAQKGRKKKTKKKTKLALAYRKSENFSGWYSEVIYRSGLIDEYDIGGCYVLRPWSYAIWEQIQSFFDSEIKKLGIKNCYFPMFVRRANLEREADHIEGFSPEV